MKFNVSYMGPIGIQHLRRDFMLAIKYGLEDLGHDVMLTAQRINPSRENIIICPNWLNKESADALLKSRINYIAVNTEIIADDMLNYKPEKCDFNGVFLPILGNAVARWDVVIDNLPEYKKYGMNSQFLRWGYHEKMKEIEHREKEFDFYFFGMPTSRRVEIIKKIASSGLKGETDAECPIFIRNEKIARAKVNLCLSQSEKFTHVPSFRTCYLSNNDCYIVSEPENDDAGYLDSADVVEVDMLIDHIKSTKEDWKRRGEENCEKFKKHHMKDCMERLLDESLC